MREPRVVQETFATRLVAWQRAHGRHDLPWQGEDAYRVWLSEIMLQQTQVATVIPYYQRFVASFPDIAALAAATEEQVLEHWSGLGYYARGRNLHRAARLIVEKHQGEFPRELEQILELPGIGRSTAAAICALAFHQRRAILDGNVKRVLTRYCGVTGWTGDKKIEAVLWQQAEALLPPPAGDGWGEGENVKSNATIAVYIQAQMDMGATVCTRSKPKCAQCPVQQDCVAHQTDRVAEFPTPRPRKVVPERHSTFLLLVSGRDILLEKRAPQGIWGGLWCLPQLDDGGELPEEYAQRTGITVNARIELDAFIHTFTHFKLHITPVLLYVAHKPLQVQQAGRVWLDVEDALRAAIPVPVRSLLEQMNRNGRLSALRLAPAG
ncbi:MAG: A/G-specific adenine glycosylase [Gallionella sp.]|nr:A/G-specific adenine glycosylase [Gallionella sp.]